VDEDAFGRLCFSIDPDWIDTVLYASGTAMLRKRRLPAELVLGMSLYQHRPIDELVGRLDLALPGVKRGAVAKSAVAKARARLGDEPVQWLFEHSAEKWAHESARWHAWRGLAVYSVDGTTIRVPDSRENRVHFGGQWSGEQRSESGYPLVRAVTLIASRNHLLAAGQFVPYADERIYAKEPWAQVPARALVIVDRGFWGDRDEIYTERTS